VGLLKVIMKCHLCQRNEATYKLIPQQNLCDYCYSIAKWNGKKMRVEEHLCLRGSLKLFYQAVEEFLKPKVHSLIPKEDRVKLLSLKPEEMVKQINTKYHLLSDFCGEHNLSIHDIIAALREVNHEPNTDL